MAGMVQIRVTHRGVFTHNVHATHLVWVTVRRKCLVHDFHHRVARLVVQLGLPKIFKPRMHALVGDALVIGEHHRNQSSITGALHIVLPTQRVQARAGFANLSRHRDQGNQTARIVGAVDVLAHAHAP